MPIYEYRCPSCGKDFELTRSIAQASEPAPCPACGKSSQKLVSSFASKVDYAIKGPTKEPFRAATGAGTAKPAPKVAAKPSAKLRAKAK